MYWLAIVVFMAGVLVPEIVQQGYAVFREDEVEVMLLLALNGILFFIFLWTDRALRAQQINTRATVQEAHDASKDLGKAYSHIGEMNRKIDVVTQFASYAADSGANAHDGRELCDHLRQSSQMLSRHEKCHVYIIDEPQRKILERSHGAPQLTQQQIATLIESRTGTHMSVGDKGELVMSAIHKTRPPLVVAIVAENAGDRRDGNETLLRMLSMIALNALQNDQEKVLQRLRGNSSK